MVAFSCMPTLPRLSSSRIKLRIVTKACTYHEGAIGSKKFPIKLENINFHWPNGRCALQDINLNVEAGELAMIVGPNGCGKSTLLSVANRLILPDTGNVNVESPCSYVRQDPDLQIVMPTIGSNIALSIPGGKDMPVKQVKYQVAQALESVGLSPAAEYFGKTSYRLSGGQRQLSVIAAALVNEPRTILFDEVTACIDPFNKEEILMRVRKLVSERGIASLWVTHLLDELDAADTIIVMKAGKIIAKGPRVLMMPLIYDMEAAA